MMHPTQHEKMEWARCAQAAYKAGHNRLGHALSAAAALPHDADMPVARYDFIAGTYRTWLVFGEIA